MFHILQKYRHIDIFFIISKLVSKNIYIAQKIMGHTAL